MKHTLYILLIFLFTGLNAQIGSSKQGFSSSIGRGVGVETNAGVNYNDSADALFLRFASEPPKSLKVAISQWYDTIQKYHIDDSLDLTYCFAVDVTGNAVISWIGRKTATLVNSPTFTAYEGYLTDGASSYIKANYNPVTDKVHLRLDGVSMAIYIRTNTIVDGYILAGIHDGTNLLYMRCRASDLLFRINSTNYSTLTHSGTISGFTLANRPNSTQTRNSRNGGTYVVNAVNSVAIPNQADGIYIGTINSEGSSLSPIAEQFAFFHIGGDLTQTQATKLFQADERFLDTFGKGIVP